jgi:NAD(P)-dependent dehydrogenase (short-subunit alcohol dehydrogenase family)
MKIAITGHSRGIGRACFDLFSAEHECVGFSRSNGFNIDKNQELIIREASDCDVFINNAYSDFSQTEILKKLFYKWHDNNTKTIVNIISRSKYYKVGQTRSDEYCMQKRALYDVAESMMLSKDKKCRIINVNPGYVRTDMIPHISADVNVLKAEEIAECIKWTLTLPKHIEIGELSLWHV